MKSIIAKSLTMVCVWASIGMVAATEPRPSIDWQTDLEKAVANARESKKPLLIQMTASWCGYCELMQRQTYQDRSVIAEVNEQFIPVKVDADQNPEIMQLLKVKALPTTVVVVTEAYKSSSFTGYRSAQQLQADLKPFCK